MGMFRVRVGSWVIHCVYESPFQHIKTRMCVCVYSHNLDRSQVRVMLSEAFAVLHRFDVEHC